MKTQNTEYTKHLGFKIGIRTIAPEENFSPRSVRVRASFRVRGQFSEGTIVPEPLKSLQRRSLMVKK